MKTRFIKSAIATAAATETRLPWQRGTVRAETIAARKAAPVLKRA